MVVVSQRAWSCSSAPLASIQIWGSGGSNKPESPGVWGETFLEVQDQGEKREKGEKFLSFFHLPSPVGFFRLPTILALVSLPREGELPALLTC